ncbi:hypothetical protein GCM10009038_26130 [Salinicola rhizosphaerae]|uniref:ABC transmembrane type-1 domain-containing protein n=1 Tax=Salinicola rhizosphaerae TaxID=1443141 RepID=A0ABQ3E7M7_9GAMM|nr:hypothetical protein GCM10009038_26130 [Salinicola rhizosphaerae]
MTERVRESQVTKKPRSVRQLAVRHAMPLKIALGWLALLALWEIAGRQQWVAGGALPSPSGILGQLVVDWHDYPEHIRATVRTSLLGFLLGNLVAVLVGFLMASWRPAGRLLSGVNVTLFAMPPIALTPILIIAFDGDAPRIALAALSTYYPTMVATVLGLTRVDARLLDLVRLYGGGRWATLRWIRLRHALPTLLAGLRVAAPNAVLGSLLAEFGSGSGAGLGHYLIGSLGRGDPARLWGIGLVATAISAGFYLAILLLARGWVGRQAPAQESLGGSSGGSMSRASRLLCLAISITLPVLLWWGAVWGLERVGVSSFVLRSPPELVAELFSTMRPESLTSIVGGALAQTVPWCLAGMLVGLAFALLLAIVGTLSPVLGRVLMPLSLLTQSMPLVALTPLIVLIFGRDGATILAITISVTFFPAYVTLAQGMALVPAATLDCVRVLGGSRWREIGLVSLPWSLPYLCAAARLVAPRAFLGVMIAEWLATGTGVGNLLNVARGSLDYGLVWAVVVAAVLVSVLLYLAVTLVEHWVLKRYAMAPAP